MGKGQTRWKRWNNPKPVNKTKSMEKMKEIKMLDCCPAIGGHAPIWRPTSIDPIISILHPLLFHLHCCWPFILLLERINHEAGYLAAFVWSLFTFPPFEVAVRFSVALNEKQLKRPATGKWSQSIASSGRPFISGRRPVGLRFKLKSSADHSNSLYENGSTTNKSWHGPLLAAE